MTDRILPAVLPSLFRGLQDVDDDVRAVAAAALVPVAHDLVRLLPQQVWEMINTALILSLKKKLRKIKWILINWS